MVNAGCRSRARSGIRSNRQRQPDYYGGARPGDNKWANSVVALKASTGAFVWGFQVVHHDLWDYDVASQPTLIEFHGKPAVAVTTKIGHVFVLDRSTGKPLNAVEERAVPKSDIAGEDASPCFSQYPHGVRWSLRS